MKIESDIASGIGVALNEATLLGLEYSEKKKIVWSTFSVLTLPEVGPEPEDPRRIVIFEQVGRISISLRLGRWDDENPQILSIKNEEILKSVQSFGGQPVYGWELLNTEDEEFLKWQNSLSLDIIDTDGCADNLITLFQEGSTENKHMDIWIRFGSLKVFDPSKKEIDIEEFICGGTRWWDALHAGDHRTDGHGIIPAG